jgi:hypothetical protein
MKRFVALSLVVSLVGLGCYNTSYVPRSELTNMQTPPEEGRIEVKDRAGKDVTVLEDTRLFVRSTGGRKYPITPFNFKVTESQLVASDRDYIFALDGLKDQAEVETLNKWGTALWIAGGVAIAGTIIGLIAWASATSGGTSGNQR